MFTRNGGRNQEIVELAGDTSEEFKRVSYTNISDIVPKSGFRGFEKKPVVALPRYDISPHLQKLKKVGLSDNSVREYCVDYAIHKSRLSQGCSVKIINEDLNKLREGLGRRQASRSPSSESDDQEMATIKCKFCDKMYSNEKKVQNHQAKKHMIIYKPEGKPQKRVSFSDHVIVHELREYHKCRKCTKIFDAYKVLKTHMKNEHKKRKCYICNYCKKNFVDRTFFKVHIRLHCDMCGVLLPNKLKYNLHKRDVCRVVKLHKCKTCDESFFQFMDLKDHSYEHISTYFICDICKDQFQTKCAVSHHISFLHSKKRPKSLYDMRNLGSERLYLCNFCEESSVERDVVEKHVQLLPDLTNRRMTGYKDYYFCDQCLKKFGAETDMLQHKWTHFLKTSDNSQVRPKGILTKKEEKSEMKLTYKIGEELPNFLQPRLVLEKIKVGGKVLEDVVDNVDIEEIVVNINSFDVHNGDIKKPVVDPKSKKTIISKHQCQTCGKYYSSNYCLNRHIESQHSDYEKLQCKVCEETFVWPSLLKSHKCIRLRHPEMPFDDARPEIHFDNLQDLTPNGFDNLNIVESDDYMNSVDFEIPAPIVQLTECSAYNHVSQDKIMPIHSLGYKVVMQEVPIEF